jgi:hypothetical protein
MDGAGVQVVGRVTGTNRSLMRMLGLCVAGSNSHGFLAGATARGMTVTGPLSGKRAASGFGRFNGIRRATAFDVSWAGAEVTRKVRTVNSIVSRCRVMGKSS